MHKVRTSVEAPPIGASVMEVLRENSLAFLDAIALLSEAYSVPDSILFSAQLRAVSFDELQLYIRFHCIAVGKALSGPIIDRNCRTQRLIVTV